MLRDSLTVPELDGARLPVMELWHYDPADPGDFPLAMNAIQRRMKAREVVDISAVQVVVTTRWPSVSLALAERAVNELNEFNVAKRQSQARQEQSFLTKRVEDAREQLRSAEAQLLDFLKRNRAITESPDLMVERDRLSRAVSMRQTLYTTLMSDLAQAEIRTVRDTPVLILLERPHLPVRPRSKALPVKVMLGFLFGAFLAVAMAVGSAALSRARGDARPEAVEFFRLLAESRPQAPWKRRPTS